MLRSYKGISPRLGARVYVDAVHATPALAAARLFLAEWGYNTLEQRASVGWRHHVRLLSLGAWTAPLDSWSA